MEGVRLNVTALVFCVGRSRVVCTSARITGRQYKNAIIVVIGMYVEENSVHVHGSSPRCSEGTEIKSND